MTDLNLAGFDTAGVGMDLHAAPGCVAQGPAELWIRLVVETDPHRILALHAKDDSRPIANLDGRSQFLHVASSPPRDRVREASQTVHHQGDRLDFYQAGCPTRRFQEEIEAAGTMDHFTAKVNIATERSKVTASKRFFDQVVGQTSVHRYPTALELDEAQIKAGLASRLWPLKQEEPATRHQQLTQPTGIGQVSPDAPAVDPGGHPKAIVAGQKAARHQIALDFHVRLPSADEADQA